MIFPNIDPVAFSVGPLAVRWYGLAYFAGILLGALLARHYARRFRDFALTRFSETLNDEDRRMNVSFAE